MERRVSRLQLILRVAAMVALWVMAATLVWMAVETALR